MDAITFSIYFFFACIMFIANVFALFTIDQLTKERSYSIGLIIIWGLGFIGSIIGIIIDFVFMPLSGLVYKKYNKCKNQPFNWLMKTRYIK